jgi:hypothetical protein
MGARAWWLLDPAGHRGFSSTGAHGGCCGWHFPARAACCALDMSVAAAERLMSSRSWQVQRTCVLALPLHRASQRRQRHLRPRAGLGVWDDDVGVLGVLPPTASRHGQGIQTPVVAVEVQPTGTGQPPTNHQNFAPAPPPRPRGGGPRRPPPPPRLSCPHPFPASPSTSVEQTPARAGTHLGTVPASMKPSRDTPFSAWNLSCISSSCRSVTHCPPYLPQDGRVGVKAQRHPLPAVPATGREGGRVSCRLPGGRSWSSVHELTWTAARRSHAHL